MSFRQMLEALRSEVGEVSGIAKTVISSLILGKPPQQDFPEDIQEPPTPPATWEGIYDAEDLPLQRGEMSEGMSFRK